MKTDQIIILAPLASDSVKPYKGVRQYLPTSGVQNGSLQTEGFTYDEKPSRADLEVQEGDVIIARMKDTPKVSQIVKKHKDIIVSTGFAVFRPNNSAIDSRYLYHYLNSPYFQQSKDQLCTGATQKAITNAGISKLTISIPDTIQKQKKIAAILDKADSIRRKRQKAIELSDEFLRSIFLDMFGDPAVNPKGWDKAPIKELGTVMTGNTPSREKPEYYGDGIEWIKSDNINTPNHFLTEAKESLTSEGQKVGRIVPKTSILVTCIAGSPECIGNAAIADRAVAFNQQINAVTSFEGVDPYFLYVQILVAKKLIQKQSTESMKGMVNKGKFENIIFLNPPYPLQEKFGKVFNKFHDAFQKNNKALSESNNLYGAITQKAFKGEL